MNDKMISVTNVVENVFCEKFTYYDNVLGLPQYEEKRGTVDSGKKLHMKHEVSNKVFVPKNLEGKKFISVMFYSKRYKYVGKIDEAIEMDKHIILIERKFSDYTRIHDTIKVQLGLLAILIEENLKKPVYEATIIFTKSKRVEISIKIDETIKQFALSMLERTKRTIESGIMPDSHYDNRCLHCCYRKICPVGSLNTN